MHCACRTILLACVLALMSGGTAFARANTTRAVTVTNSSAAALAATVNADGPRTFLAIVNESATATIACNFGGTAAANTAGNYTIPPASTRVWGPFPIDMPMDGRAVNCISSAATSAATIESSP